MEDVAEDGDIQSLEAAPPVADRQRVEQRLRGMLVRAVTGIDHRDL